MIYSPCSEARSALCCHRPLSSHLSGKSYFIAVNIYHQENIRRASACARIAFAGCIPVDRRIPASEGAMGL